MTTKFVDVAYTHRPKQLSPAPPLAAPGVRFKWYDLAPLSQPVPPQVQQLARDTVAARSAELGFDGDLGFVVLHRCGEDFFFLLLCTWRGSNELWESVFAKPNASAPDFEPFQRESIHKPTFCVWELAAVEHERRAWIRFLSSQRGAREEEGYLADSAQAQTV